MRSSQPAPQLVLGAAAYGCWPHKLGTVLRLYGIPVPEPDARRLIATLLADGGDVALSAAALITRGLDHQLAAIAASAALSFFIGFPVAVTFDRIARITPRPNVLRTSVYAL